MEDFEDGMPPDDGPSEETLRIHERTAKGESPIHPAMKAYRRSKMPAKYVIEGCTLGCSLNARKLPGELGKLLMEWFEEGRSDREIQVLAKRAANVHLSTGAISRHYRGHLQKVWEADKRVYPHDMLTDDEVADKGNRNKGKSHLEILETIIQRGAEHLPTGRISPELTLKAMEMHFKMTQGSAIDATLAAIKGAFMGEVGDDGVPVPMDHVLPENEDALVSEEEQQMISEVVDDGRP